MCFLVYKQSEQVRPDQALSNSITVTGLRKFLKHANTKHPRMAPEFHPSICVLKHVIHVSKSVFCCSACLRAISPHYYSEHECCVSQAVRVCVEQTISTSVIHVVIHFAWVRTFVSNLLFLPVSLQLPVG